MTVVLAGVAGQHLNPSQVALQWGPKRNETAVHDSKANDFLADRTVARSAIGYWHDTILCLSVLSVRLSATKCIVALTVSTGGWKLYCRELVLLVGYFLFTSSDTLLQDVSFRHSYYFRSRRLASKHCENQTAEISTWHFSAVRILQLQRTSYAVRSAIGLLNCSYVSCPFW